MLEELERTLPRVRKYEQELPMTSTLEDALCDTYTEVIVFCAHAVTFFRSNPNVAPSRSAGSHFSSEFARVVANLRTYSRRVDETADMTRLSRETHTANTVKALASLQVRATPDAALPCHVAPHAVNLRFFGRAAELHALRSNLYRRGEGKNEGAGDGSEQTLRVAKICGLGGVGKP
jgi:hypothetical protein